MMENIFHESCRVRLLRMITHHMKKRDHPVECFRKTERIGTANLQKRTREPSPGDSHHLLRFINPADPVTQCDKFRTMPSGAAADVQYTLDRVAITSQQTGNITGFTSIILVPVQQIIICCVVRKCLRHANTPHKVSTIQSISSPVRVRPLGRYRPCRNACSEQEKFPVATTFSFSAG